MNTKFKFTAVLGLLLMLPFAAEAQGGFKIWGNGGFKWYDANTVDSIVFYESSPEKKAMHFLAGDQSKWWTWDYDAPSGSTCWGNGGHTGDGAAYKARTVDGHWWGVSTPEELLDQTTQAGGVVTGAESRQAFMVFNTNGTMQTYGGDGRQIYNSNFTIDGYDESRPTGWEVAKLSTDKPAVLFPFSINEGGVTVKDFDVMYLDENYLTLVYTKGNEAGSWGEITHWMFKNVEHENPAVNLNVVGYAIGEDSVSLDLQYTQYELPGLDINALETALGVSYKDVLAYGVNTDTTFSAVKGSDFWYMRDGSLGYRGDDAALNLSNGAGDGWKYCMYPDEKLAGGTYTANIAFVNDSLDAYLYHLTIHIKDSWNYLGEGTFSDFWICDGAFPVQIYQNGYNQRKFRLVNPYKELWNYWGTAYTEGGWQLCTPSDTIEFKVYEAGQIINEGKEGLETMVSETGYVYYDAFNIGLHNPSYGADVYNIHPSDFKSLAGDEGNLAWNKVTQWQDNGLPSAVYMAGYRYMYGVGGWGGYKSGDEAVLVLFPGCVLKDYSFEMETGVASDGKLPVTFTAGKDIASVDYCVYKGILSDDEITARKADIGCHAEPAVSTIRIDASVVVQTLCLEETGQYTIVAVAFDTKGKNQADAASSFGYVKAGDDEKVACKAGCSLNMLPESYVAAGYSKRNSLLVNLWGQGVTQAWFCVIDKLSYEADSIGCWNDLNALDDGELESLNEPGGYSKVRDGLKTASDYILLYKVFNGFVEQRYTAVCSTPELMQETMWYGKYTYNFYWSGDGTYKLSYIPEDNQYFIENWGGGVDFTFRWDNDTTVVVSPQYAGTELNGYGALYIVDRAQYWKGYEEIAKSAGMGDISPSYYDPQARCFHFNLEYYVSAGTFGGQWETFSYVSDEMPSAVSAIKSVASANGLDLKAFRNDVKVPFRAKPYSPVDVNLVKEEL